jgi:hypothetical protein
MNSTDGQPSGLSCRTMIDVNLDDYDPLISAEAAVTMAIVVAMTEPVKRVCNDMARPAWRPHSVMNS